MNKCCFCGHSRIWEVDCSIVDELTLYIKYLITMKHVEIFYSGGMGTFDQMCEDIVKSLKLKYPQIRLCLVVPYLSHT